MQEAAPKLRRLTKRAQFLRAARGVRASRPGLGLQMIPVDADLAGVGFTVTNKIGNAPERNRIKRRLRAAARACASEFKPRHDYVLLGRREALNQPFPGLVSGLVSLLTRVHANRQEAKRT